MQHIDRRGSTRPSRRIKDGDPNIIASLFLSILGVNFFWRAGDIPVMIISVGLTLIYAMEIPTRLCSWNRGGRVVGFFQFITGIWLMYCTYAMTVDLALGATVWIQELVTHKVLMPSNSPDSVSGICSDRTKHLRSMSVKILNGWLWQHLDYRLKPHRTTLQ